MLNSINYSEEFCMGEKIVLCESCVRNVHRYNPSLIHLNLMRIIDPLRTKKVDVKEIDADIMEEKIPQKKSASIGPECPKYVLRD